MTDPRKPFNLEEIRERWLDANRYSGTSRWNPIVEDLVTEVERLDALLDRIGTNSDDISDSIVHYREHRTDHP